MRKKSKTTEMTEGDQPVAIQHLLTVADVASILRLSRVKVYELIKRDGLPTLKINGARHISPESSKPGLSSITSNAEGTSRSTIRRFDGERDLITALRLNAANSKKEKAYASTITTRRSLKGKTPQG